ncbi:hypothetical protein L1887_53997 [Cichorium endivia]|nr:hypothetical protein L1887_53997 [Cichorium endivia]
MVSPPKHQHHHRLNILRRSGSGTRAVSTEARPPPTQLDQFGIPVHHAHPTSSRPAAHTPSRSDAMPTSPSFPTICPPGITSSSSSRRYLANAPAKHAASPSPSSQPLAAEPSSLVTRTAPRLDDEDEDESVGLLLGQSKRRRPRKDSYSSFGSSVLPAPLFASNTRYGDHDASAFPRQPLPSKPSRSRYPPSNHSAAAPASRHLVPPAQSDHQRQRQNSNAVASRPSGFDLDDWLRTSQAPPPVLRSSPSLGALASFDRQDYSGRTAAASEAGNRRRRNHAGSTSGLSAGVLSAGPESPRSRRKASASSRREQGTFSSLASDHPAFMASQELTREAGSRTIDTIEEWRAKSAPKTPETSVDAATPAAQESSANPDQPDQPVRRRRKSSVKGASRPVSMDGPPPPLPSIPATFGAESVTSKSGRRRRKGTETSLAGLLSPDRTSHRAAAPLPMPPPALRDLYALSGLGSQAETPIRRLIRWLAKEQLKSVILPLALLVAFLYWGLDYPPLTAWVSLACGYASRLFPATAAGFAFETSRGNEDAATVTFMRATVIVGDLLFYLPAVVLFVSRKLEGRGRRTQAIALFAIFLQPALILIDHGHFQYNSIMLGLSAACFALLYTTLPNPDASSTSQGARNRSQAVADLSRQLSYEYVAAAVFFCLSLSFKQMALYYAPAVFAVMLGRCIGLARVDPERGLTLFIGLGLAVVVTFGIVFCAVAREPRADGAARAPHLSARARPVRGQGGQRVVLPLGAAVASALQAEKHDGRIRTREAQPGSDARHDPARMLLALLGREPDGQDGDDGGDAVDAALSAAGSVKAPTAVSRKSADASKRRSPSVVGSAVGGPARSEIESLLAGSVSRSISGRVSQAGTRTDVLDRLSARADADRAEPGMSERPVASTLPSPAAQMLPYGLVSVSCAFFLFGFQTHEKSILLPLLPMTLMLGAKGDTWGGHITSARDWEWAVWFNNIATFSLFPLLLKDGQALQYVVLIIGWNWLVGNLQVPWQPLSAVWAVVGSRTSFFRRLSTLTYMAAVALHGAEVVLPRLVPGLHAKVLARYPDIYPVLNVLLTAPCFAIVFVWALIRQVQVAFANGLDLSFGKPGAKKKSA